MRGGRDRVDISFLETWLMQQIGVDNAVRCHGTHVEAITRQGDGWSKQLRKNASHIVQDEHVRAGKLSDRHLSKAHTPESLAKTIPSCNATGNRDGVGTCAAESRPLETCVTQRFDCKITRRPAGSIQAMKAR